MLDGKRKSFLGKAAILLIFVFLFIWVAGCASSGSLPKDAMDEAAAEPSASSRTQAAMGEIAGYSMNSQVNQVAFDDHDGSFSKELEEVDRLPDSSERRYIIQNASLTLEITDIEEAAESIRGLVEQMDGYIASLNFYDLTRERRMGQISLRVPADKYSQLMLLLQEQGEVKNIEESTNDVSMEYIDLEARIANLQAQEQRIRELLEKAKEIEDILAIEKELTRIRGDLESMQGEFKYLQEKVTFSSIHVSLEEKDPREYAVVDEFTTFGEELGERFSLNTNRVIKGLTGLVLAFLGSLPLLLTLAVLGLLLWKGIIFFRRKNEKKQLEEEKKTTP